MSQRGSFTSEFIYCDKCAALVREAIENCPSLYTFSEPVKAPGGQYPNIIAGLAKTGYCGEEIEDVRECLENVSSKLCDGHDIRFMVFPETPAKATYFHVRDGEVELVEVLFFKEPLS